MSEYQRYLDKAHEQRRTYLGKLNQTKNKVPPLRHDSFVKTHQPTFQKFTDYYNTNSYYNPNVFKVSSSTFNNPLDLFVPVNSPPSYFNNAGHDTVSPQKKSDSDFSSLVKPPGEKKPFIMPPLIRKSFEEPIKSPCICPSHQIPCKCNCKQCLIPLNPTNPNYNQLKLKYPELNKQMFSHNPLLLDPRISEHLLDDMSNTANTVNVKIKVDIQLPKNLDALTNYNNQQHNRDSALEYEDMSKELNSNIRLPTTSFNFPIPLTMFGYKRSSKINRHDSTPFRKITIHKKKKSRPNGNVINKRHRKKLITFHNIKVSTSPQTSKLSMSENHNMSISQKKEVLNETHQNVTENRTLNIESTNYTTTSTELPLSKNTTQFQDSIYFMVNISNNNDNETDETIKTGNSIELELAVKPNMSAPNIREKRNVITEIRNNSTIFKTEANTTAKFDTKAIKYTNSIKSIEKLVLSEAELLYWPANSLNVSATKCKNITDLILEKETNKAKLNMSTEAIRHNRTNSLEQAVFGQLDWNDMDTVAPTFISFIGKYINGILTFCSEKICHSMKCSEKMCIHRTCLPGQRFNHIGHCTGFNQPGK